MLERIRLQLTAAKNAMHRAGYYMARAESIIRSERGSRLS